MGSRPTYDTKNKQAMQYRNAPDKVLMRAREFYASTLCNCRRSNAVINCTAMKKPSPQFRAQYDTTGTWKEVDPSGENDLQGLLHLLSRGNGGGTKVEVDSEGNLLWRKPETIGSYGRGVGRMGRIDENRSCSFNEVDANKLRFCSSIKRRNIDS